MATTARAQDRNVQYECQPTTDTPQRSGDPDEQAVFEDHPDAVGRDAKGELTVTLFDGRRVHVPSDTHCKYSLRVVDLRANRWLILNMAYYEGDTYYVFDRKLGTKTDIDARPVFSPSGRQFVT